MLLKQCFWKTLLSLGIDHMFSPFPFQTGLEDNLYPNGDLEDVNSPLGLGRKYLMKKLS